MKHFHAVGTFDDPIIDSDLFVAEALRPNPKFDMPAEIFQRQVPIKVTYVSFDGKYHQGQIVIDVELAHDVRDFFDFLVFEKFPVHSAIPVAHPDIEFDDLVSMAMNNSSGFNPRYIAGTNKLSEHAPGRALDVNPLQNPYVGGSLIQPPGAFYDVTKPGTFVAGSSIVRFLKKRGWAWGGDFKDKKDYHHFQKPR